MEEDRRKSGAGRGQVAQSLTPVQAHCRHSRSATIGRKNGLSEREKGSILAVKAAGDSLHAISGKVKRSRNVIRRYLADLDAYGLNYVSDNSLKLMPAVVKRITNVARSRQFSTSRQMAKNLRLRGAKNIESLA
ncbi:hypothetical protein FVE85_9534 [Porphyridium purpureum]|uniref:Tc3 transposase DNA binding domain-containing protein n=1 Tax=Porphyridium purpureum TaxID=35688 RepID=A0A5J4YIM0_PORPP|nr:hypothetical protein FVE85_9534 [Porphyridium purpureum]|eukprot:POR6952..scf261_15